MGLLITGMHRSGTSMLAQWAFRLGTRPPGGAEFPVDDANPRGLYESKDLVELNDGWLEQLGGSWWAPPRVKQQTWRSVDGVRLSRARESVAGLRTAGGPPWFVKDPRISLLLPLWDRLLLDRLPILVAVRSHREVAMSLNLRDGMTHRRAMAVWLDYNRQVVRHGQGRPSLVVDYSSALADPGTSLKALAQLAESEVNPTQADELDAVASGVERHLHRQRVDSLTGSAESLARELDEHFHVLHMAHGGHLPSELPDTPDWVEEALDELSEFWGLKEQRDWTRRNMEALLEERDTIREERDAIREDRDAIREDRDAIRAERDDFYRMAEHLRIKSRLRRLIGKS